MVAAVAEVPSVPHRWRQRQQVKIVRNNSSTTLYPSTLTAKGKAMAEGNKWYFFSRKTQNRITGNGYWKPFGVDEPIFTSASRKVGIKKYYVFHMGEAPAGVKTNWIMEEYRLSDSGSSSRSSSKRRGNPKIDYSKWVVCRVFEHSCNDSDSGTDLSCLDEVYLSLDDLEETSFPN